MDADSGEEEVEAAVGVEDFLEALDISDDCSGVVDGGDNDDVEEAGRHAKPGAGDRPIEVTRQPQKDMRVFGRGPVQPRDYGELKLGPCYKLFIITPDVCATVEYVCIDNSSTHFF